MWREGGVGELYLVSFCRVFVEKEIEFRQVRGEEQAIRQALQGRGFCL
jgi:hypothetical protein